MFSDAGICIGTALRGNRRLIPSYITHITFHMPTPACPQGHECVLYIFSDVAAYTDHSSSIVPLDWPTTILFMLPSDTLKQAD